MKEAKKNIAVTLWNAFGITIIVAFFVFSMVVGGSAGNGYQESGKYFLGEHGNYVEVSQTVWTVSCTLEVLFWIFIPLTPIGALVIAKIQEVKERRRYRFE